MAAQMDNHDIVMPSVAVTEVVHVAPECAKWLGENDLNQIPMSNAILQDALRIKNLLGIVGDKYGGGVDENDLFIIATARSVSARLISSESFQAVPPKAMHNYKIPTVCAMATVNVDCINFVEFVKQSKTVFG